MAIRYLRPTAATSADRSDKRNWEISADGVSWQNLNDNGDALPWNKNDDEDCIIFDSAQTQAFTPSALPGSKRSLTLEVKADGNVNPWTGQPPNQTTNLIIRKANCPTPNAGIVVSALVEIYATLGSSLGMFAMPTSSNVVVNVRVAGNFLPGMAGGTIYPKVGGVIVQPSAGYATVHCNDSDYIASVLPDDSEVQSGVTFGEGGAVTGTARVNSSIQTGGVPVAVV